MVKIIADSTCDLSPELLKRYDIGIIPLHILLGTDEYKDGLTITPEEIFRWSDENKTTPKTSAPSLEDTVQILEPYVRERREVICFSISDSMSSSGNVMRIAAAELEAEDLVTLSLRLLFRHKKAPLPQKSKHRSKRSVRMSAPALWSIP